MTKLNITAVVISPDWPSENSGLGLAVKSSLQQYDRIFARVHFIGLVDRNFREKGEWFDTDIMWTHIPIVRYPKWLRFLKSLLSSLPAVCMQFTTRTVQQQLLEIVATHKRKGEEVAVIVEEVPPACSLFLLRREFPTIPVAVRSLNMLSKAFEKFCFTGFFFSRVAWCLELQKIRKFENQVFEIADRFWAISKDDAKAYWERLGVRCHGIISVSLEAERYNSVAHGDIFTVVHVGSADLRKGQGLIKFIENAWQEIHSSVPEASLLLGGRGTERFTQSSQNIKGYGYVDDDRDILSKGVIFANPQEIGAGIKLKSIVAMLAGKVLVSTNIGIEGIEGEDGVHFFVGNDAKDLGRLIIRLMCNEELVHQISANARELAATVYSHENLTQVTEPLLRDFVRVL